MVRASDYGPFPSPWGRPKAILDHRHVELLVADVRETEGPLEPGRVVEVGPDGVAVGTGEGAVVVRRLRLDGTNHQAGHVLRVGDRFQRPRAPNERTGAGSI